MAFRKSSIQDFQHQIKDIRGQLIDQVKFLEQRTDTQVAILGEISDFLKKKAELDAEYSKQTEKLVKSIMLKHKNEKQRRATWPLYSICQLWQQLVDDAKEEAKQRSIVADVFSNYVAPAVAQRSAMLHKIAKKCREVGILAQGEVVRVLSELQTAMKTYQLCFDQLNALTGQLEAQRTRAQNAGNSSRKQRSVQKTMHKINQKHQAASTKCTRARNEYLLCIDAANASLHKYFADDISDLVDCSDLGMDWWISLVLQNVMAARKSACQVEMTALANLGSFKESLQSHSDKQRFFESHHQAFMLPRRFDFKCEEAECISKISLADGGLAVEEFRQRHHQIRKRMGTLRAETELSWQNMEDTERQIRELLNAATLIEVTEFGIAEKNERPAGEQLESELSKAYDSYVQIFSFYLFNQNLIMRLEARADGIGSALANVNCDPGQQNSWPLGGAPNASSSTTSSNGRQNLELSKSDRGPSVSSSIGGGEQDGEVPDPEWAERRRKRRIGSHVKSDNYIIAPGTKTHLFTAQTSADQSAAAPVANPFWRRPRLFGGSLEEYTETTGELIPMVVVSCIRLLSKFALHHQGLFRISGSQLEINHMREAFEIGDDPLRDVQDGSDANSVAGVLKLYLRELREPLFPFYLFDLLTDCAKCSSASDFVEKISPLLNKLPRATYLLLRYLFAFLNHLSEFSDENMMDPYNLAICFGPTLLPIPEGKDQVSYQNSVNEVVKNLIVQADSVFTARLAGPRYEKYAHAMEDITPLCDQSADLEYVDNEILSVDGQPVQQDVWPVADRQHMAPHITDLPFPQTQSPRQYHYFQSSPQQQQHQRHPFLAHAPNASGSQKGGDNSFGSSPPSLNAMQWSMCSTNSSNLMDKPPLQQQQQQRTSPNNNNGQRRAAIKAHGDIPKPVVLSAGAAPFQQRRHMEQLHSYSSSESGVGGENSTTGGGSMPKQQQQQQQRELAMAAAAAVAVNGLRASGQQHEAAVIGAHSPQQHLVKRYDAAAIDRFSTPAMEISSDLYTSIQKGDPKRCPVQHVKPAISVVQRTQSHQDGRKLDMQQHEGGPTNPPAYSALFGAGVSATGRAPSTINSGVSSASQQRTPSSASNSTPSPRRNSLSASADGAKSSTSSSAMTVLMAQQQRTMDPGENTRLQQQRPAAESRITPISASALDQQQSQAEQLRRQRMDQINAIDELLGKLSTATDSDETKEAKKH